MLLRTTTIEVRILKLQARPLNPHGTPFAHLAVRTDLISNEPVRFDLMHSETSSK